MKQIEKLAITALIAVTVLGSACKKEETRQKYILNATASTATWKGYQRSGYFNEGAVNVQSANLEVVAGVVKSGYFEMPLSSLANLNLPTDSLKDLLIHHLKSADFFNMPLYPSLSFLIKTVEVYSGNIEGAIPNANYVIKGDFTMLGKSLPLSFPAKIEISNKQLFLTAIFTIDRTKWGMNYGALDTLPDDQYIKPEVDIYLQLSGTRI